MLVSQISFLAAVQAHTSIIVCDQHNPSGKVGGPRVHIPTGSAAFFGGTEVHAGDAHPTEWDKAASTDAHLRLHGVFVPLVLAKAALEMMTAGADIPPCPTAPYYKQAEHRVDSALFPLTVVEPTPCSTPSSTTCRCKGKRNTTGGSGAGFGDAKRWAAK